MTWLTSMHPAAQAALIVAAVLVIAVVAVLIEERVRARREAKRSDFEKWCDDFEDHLTDDDDAPDA